MLFIYPQHLSMLSTLMYLLYSPWLPQGRPTGICLSISFQSLIVWLTCTPKRNWVILSLTHFLPEHTLYPFLFISSSPKMAYPSLLPWVCTQQISKQKTEELLLLALFFQSFYFLFFNTAFNPGGGRVKLISLSPHMSFPFLYINSRLSLPGQRPWQPSTSSDLGYSKLCLDFLCLSYLTYVWS